MAGRSRFVCEPSSVKDHFPSDSGAQPHSTKELRPRERTFNTDCWCRDNITASRCLTHLVISTIWFRQQILSAVHARGEFWSIQFSTPWSPLFWQQELGKEISIQPHASWSNTLPQDSVELQTPSVCIDSFSFA